MQRSITMPTELEVLAVPPLALLSVLEVSLTMLTAVIHCEHLDLNEFPRFFEAGGLPPKSLILARTICDRAQELTSILEAYQTAVLAEISKLKKSSDSPF
jgi:hypothetical protein